MAGKILGLLLAAEIMLGCAPKGDVVRIALAVPLTGDMGSEGQGLRRAVEMAIEEANDSRIFPYRLELAPFDDRANPREATSVANLIISDRRIVAVIGHYNSHCAIPAAKIYAGAGIPMISPAATHPELTRQQLESDWFGPRVVFRVVPTDDVQGTYAARFVYQRLGKRRMALIHDRTTYGQGLEEQFRKTFVVLGGKVVSEDGISMGDRNFKALLTRLGELKPDGIYFGGLYTEAGLLLRQMQAMGLQCLFVSGDGAKTPGLFDIAGGAADGVYVSIVGLPIETLPGARNFIARYKKRWPDDVLRHYDHVGYDAAQIIFGALAVAGPDRKKLLEALRHVRHKGILGLTVFDEKGDTLNQTVTMMRADAGARGFIPIPSNAARPGAVRRLKGPGVRKPLGSGVSEP